MARIVATSPRSPGAHNVLKMFLTDSEFLFWWNIITTYRGNFSLVTTEFISFLDI
jgi:hypothetical protein